MKRSTPCGDQTRCISRVIGPLLVSSRMRQVSGARRFISGWSGFRRSARSGPWVDTSHASPSTLRSGDLSIGDANTFITAIALKRGIDLYRTIRTPRGHVAVPRCARTTGGTLSLQCARVLPSSSVWRSRSATWIVRRCRLRLPPSRRRSRSATRISPGSRLPFSRLWRDVRGRRRAHRSTGNTPRFSRHHDRVVVACAAHGLATGLRTSRSAGSYSAPARAEAFLPRPRQWRRSPRVSARRPWASSTRARRLALSLRHPSSPRSCVADWRWAFITCGAAGRLDRWWWASYQLPGDHRRLSAAERADIGDVVAHTGAGEPPPLRGSASCGFRGVGPRSGEIPDRRRLVFLPLLAAEVPYDARGFDVKQVGYYAWIPYAAAGIGSLMGGGFEQARHERTIDRCRAQNRPRRKRGSDANHHLRHPRPR